MEDQQSRIAKRAKVGCLLSPCSFLPFVSYNYAIVNFQERHKHHCHQNSYVLHDLLKYGIFGNNISPSLNIVQFDCFYVNLVKINFSPFMSTH